MWLLVSCVYGWSSVTQLEYDRLELFKRTCKEFPCRITIDERRLPREEWIEVTEQLDKQATFVSTKERQDLLCEEYKAAEERYIKHCPDLFSCQEEHRKMVESAEYDSIMWQWFGIRNFIEYPTFDECEGENEHRYLCSHMPSPCPKIHDQSFIIINRE